MKHVTVTTIVLLMLAGCAQIAPYPAPPVPQPEAARAESPATRQDGTWVPPQPYPGPDRAKTAKKIPLPGEKPKAAPPPAETTVASVGESTQKTQTAALLLQDIVGMNEARVASTLGPPFARSEKPPARIWQYRGDDCILKVRFFLDLNDQSFRALSVDAAKTDGEKDAPERCIAQVMAAKR